MDRLALLLLGALSPPPVAAPRAAVQAPDPLRWTSPSGCPESAGVLALTEAYLGGPIPTGSDARVWVTARVTPSVDSFQLELDLRAGDGATHEVHSDPSCSELAKLTAIKFALLLDPEGFVQRYDEVEALAEETLARRDETDVEPVSEAAVEAVLEPTVEPVAPSTPPASANPVRLHVGLALGPGWGQLPGTTGTGSVYVALGARWWRLEARGLISALGQVRLPDDSDAGLNVFSWGGGILGCALPRTQRFVFPVCGGAEAAALRATGQGTDSTTSATRPYAAATLAAGVTLELGRVALFARPEANLALTRARFGFVQGDDLYLVPPVSVRILAGAEVRLGR